MDKICTKYGQDIHKACHSDRETHINLLILPQATVRSWCFRERWSFPIVHLCSAGPRMGDRILPYGGWNVMSSDFRTLKGCGDSDNMTVSCQQRESAHLCSFYTTVYIFLGLRTFLKVDLCWNHIFLKIILLPASWWTVPRKCCCRLERLYLFFLFYHIQWRSDLRKSKQSQ